MRQAIGQVRSQLAASITADTAATAPTRATGLKLRGYRRPDYDVDAGNSDA